MRQDRKSYNFIPNVDNRSRLLEKQTSITSLRVKGVMGHLILLCSLPENKWTLLSKSFLFRTISHIFTHYINGSVEAHGRVEQQVSKSQHVQSELKEKQVNKIPCHDVSSGVTCERVTGFQWVT